MHRLKTRLELANFKRKYGLEEMDLRTLETNLKLTTPKRTKNRFYPNHVQYRLSEKRTKIKRTTEEDAANVLMMLHNSLCT
jgi:hypothetical protein